MNNERQFDFEATSSKIKVKVTFNEELFPINRPSECIGLGSTNLAWRFVTTGK